MRTFVVRFALAAAVLAYSDATSGSFGDLGALHQHETQRCTRTTHGPAGAFEATVSNLQPVQ